ncbi:LysR family transcriptional regulator [Pseudooceanicola sp. C21-150M6]|uniref:LysR family transcriptional regulator n=1 Tax=Pseudooceanicola sp. C21-150M6 TaxID=3434355 RepID=UPI003D7FA032
MLPRNLDLNLLRVFDTLMQERSVTRTAQRLNMTQPSASNALDRLRAVLGDRLLERRGRTMVPSQYASLLWPAVRRAMDELDAGFAQVDTIDPATLDTHLRIGMDTYASAAFGATVAAAILNAAPNARVSILPVRIDDSLARLPDLDMAIGTRFSPAVDVEEEEIFQERFVVLMRDTHPIIAGTGELTVAQYAGARHLLLSDKGIVSGNVDAALAGQSLSRSTVLASPLYETLGSVLASTDCVATLGMTIARRLMRQDALVMHAPPLDVPGFPVSMLWNGRDRHSARLAWLKALCRTSILDQQAQQTG